MATRHAALQQPLPLAPPVGLLGWARSRSLDLFRIAASTALALHFVRHALESAPRIAARAQAPRSAALARDSILASGWSSAALSTLFVSGAIVALVAAVGIVPRLCALLVYALGVVTYWALAPDVGVDDYVANVTALFLALLPLGRTLSPMRRGRSGPNASPHPVAATLLLVHMLLLYLSGAHAGAGPAGAPLTHAVLAATTLLLLEPPAHGRRDRSVLDAGGALAILHALLLLIALGGAALGAAPAASACARTLADLGLYLAGSP